MSKRTPLLLEIVALGGLVAAMHQVASATGLYWTVDWADAVLHTLGGLWIGLVALFVFFTQGWLRLPTGNRRVVAAVTIAAVLVVGLSWEIYEVFAGLTVVATDLGDTVSDLGFDLLGGLLALGYFRTALVSTSANHG